MTKEQLKKEYETGTITITKDNIHLYYEFVSDEDFVNYGRLLDNIFDERLDILQSIFKNLDYYQTDIDTEHTFMVTGLNCFGVKDTLKPIGVYIADIKVSSEYKKHISTK